jgi:2,3-bisphosphoglycerate-dependent phosphoglycerate mutase
VELVVVRHAEQAPRRLGADAIDPWLSDAGRDQARRVAVAVEPLAPAALYSSPQRRARETADFLGTRLGLPVLVDEGLAEFDHGAAYLHYEDAEGTESVYDRYQRGDLSPWGTDAATFTARVVAAMERVIAAHPGETVVVVAHGGVQNAYLGSVLGLDRLHFHFPTYTAISRVQASRRGGRSVVSINEAAHLTSPACPDPSVHDRAQQKV